MTTMDEASATLDPNATPDPLAAPWNDPADAQRSWDWDDMHAPFALTPLAGEWWRVVVQGFNLAPALFGDFPQRFHARVWNGYAYMARDDNVPEADRAAQSEGWVAVCRDRAVVTAAYWSDEVLPELRMLESQIRATPVETMTRADLASAWDEAWAAAERMWQLHFCAILGPYQILDDLADLYERLVPGASPGEALRLVQGAHTELLDMELGMEGLAESAMARPAIRQALVARASADGASRQPLSPNEVRGLPDGPAFLAELDAFLVSHGHMGQGFDDLALPSWGEEPSLVLAQLGMRLSNPPGSAEARHVRLEAEGVSLAEIVRGRLADDSDERAQFDRLLHLAREIGPLTEIHNYWIDRMAQARIRALAIRVGRRLAEAGCFDAAADVLYLDRAEIRKLIEQPLDLRPVIGERRALHAEQRTITPPRALGVPQTGIPDRFDGERFASTERDVLKGTGASAGVARGPARVTLSPADFGRIGAGDIIVCPSSNPSWVPVFTVAAGLITNTGGILSHAAVVAREFGLPAVVGTGDATSRIADGRLVEIDGSTGHVRLL